jgi:hypothetical protein
MGRPTRSGLGLSPEEYRAMGRVSGALAMFSARPAPRKTPKPRVPRVKKTKVRFKVGDVVTPLFFLHRSGFPRAPGDPMTILEVSGSRYLVDYGKGQGWVDDEVLEKV